MTQEEIIEMAIKGHASTRDAILWAMNQEKESCAKVAESEPRSWDFDAPDPQKRIAAAIRARKHK